MEKYNITDGYERSWQEKPKRMQTVAPVELFLAHKFRGESLMFLDIDHTNVGVAKAIIDIETGRYTYTLIDMIPRREGIGDLTDIRMLVIILKYHSGGGVVYGLNDPDLNDDANLAARTFLLKIRKCLHKFSVLKDTLFSWTMESHTSRYADYFIELVALGNPDFAAALAKAFFQQQCNDTIVQQEHQVKSFERIEKCPLPEVRFSS